MFPQTTLLNLREEGKKSREGNGRNMGGAITGDGEGTEEEKERDPRSPHVRSLPTLQPWLRLRKQVPNISQRSVATS